jgi:H+/Cl- antiporter ClcA
MAAATMERLLLRSRSSSISSAAGVEGFMNVAANTAALPSADAQFGDYTYKNVGQLREANMYVLVSLCVCVCACVLVRVWAWVCVRDVLWSSNRLCVCVYLSACLHLCSDVGHCDG